MKAAYNKIIRGQRVRQNPEHRGYWDIIGEGGRQKGKVVFTGTLKEVREAIKLGTRK